MAMVHVSLASSVVIGRVEGLAAGELVDSFGSLCMELSHYTLYPKDPGMS